LLLVLLWLCVLCCLRGVCAIGGFAGRDQGCLRGRAKEHHRCGGDLTLFLGPLRDDLAVVLTEPPGFVE